MSPNLQLILLVVLAFMVVGALYYAFFYNSIESRKKTSKRMKSLQVDPKEKVRAQTRKMDEKQRRKLREESLKIVDQKNDQGKSATKPILAVRRQQAGMETTPKTFYTICIVLGAISAFLSFIVFQLPWYISLGIPIVVGFGLPNWFVNFKRGKRLKKFTLAFPNAIDVIVRGIRSGLPLNDCMRIIANDAEEPVKSEFLKVIEATQVGLTMPEACERLYENVPTSETNFFAIVITIQSSAGGNLSEALANLSDVLRQRKKMSDKIQAMSMEAKASGAIIGSLPFIVAGLISFSSPGYLDPLFTTDSGHTVLAVCAFLMAFGIAVMKHMINFKF